jgi:hypothetical protein
MPKSTPVRRYSWPLSGKEFVSLRVLKPLKLTAQILAEKQHSQRESTSVTAVEKHGLVQL